MAARTQTPEADRLAALRSLDILDTPAEERFDRITRLAAARFEVPISTVTLIDEDRQWHKSCVGVGGREDPRFSENRSSPARRSSASMPASRSRRWTATASARCA